jgi:hypothetical protein
LPKGVESGQGHRRDQGYDDRAAAVIKVTLTLPF